MASLALTKVFINLMATGGSQQVAYQSSPGRTQEYKVDGSVKTYGNGRQRGVLTQGEAGTYNLVLRLVTAADLLVLRSWATQTVEVRNHKGERFVGTYFDLQVVEYFTEAAYDVTMVLSLVTAPDGV